MGLLNPARDFAANKLHRSAFYCPFIAPFLPSSSHSSSLQTRRGARKSTCFIKWIRHVTENNRGSVQEGNDTKNITVSQKLPLRHHWWLQDSLLWFTDFYLVPVGWACHKRPSSSHGAPSTRRLWITWQYCVCTDVVLLWIRLYWVFIILYSSSSFLLDNEN